MALKLPSTSSFGCSAKVRSADLSNLMQLSGREFFQSLACDAGPLSQAKSLHFSIDTISPVTRNPETFGRISVTHAIGDLYSLGAIPTDACVSIGLDSTSVKNGDGTLLVGSIGEILKEKKINLSNGHTYRSDEITVTLAIIGKVAERSPALEYGKEYDLILTKGLGASTACHFASLQKRNDIVVACEEFMLLDHGKIANSIKRFCFKGTTDISGFGFLGHVAILCQSEICEVQVDLSKIPYFEKLDEIVSPYRTNCSAQRNEEDFYEYCQCLEKLSNLEKNKLFSSETCGPILCVVLKNASKTFLQLLAENGFPLARNVGSLKKADMPSFQLLGPKI